MTGPRIVSLIASATEICCALGLEGQLVGRSHECDYPESVKRLPSCTGPKFDPDGTSYEIDQRVKAILQEGLSVYRVDADRLKALRPDLIVTQSHCDVCAVSEKDVVDAVGSWLDAKPIVVSLKPNNLADIWISIGQVGEAAGVAERAAALVSQLQARMEAIVRQAQRLRHRPRVACLEWIDPLMAAGNWMPELVQMVGGVNLFGEAGQHSPWMTWEQLRAQDPDLIVVLPCGFDIERTRQDLPLLSGKPDWNELTAVEKGKVFLTDGNQFFNRPGPRIVESLEILAEMVHPESFSFGHGGKNWEEFARI